MGIYENWLLIKYTLGLFLTLEEVEKIFTEGLGAFCNAYFLISFEHDISEIGSWLSYIKVTVLTALIDNYVEA